MENEMYLGDGVYASYDGYHVVLDLRGQDNTTIIALEPDVLKVLLHFTRCTVDADFGKERKDND